MSSLCGSLLFLWFKADQSALNYWLPNAFYFPLPILRS